MKKIKRYAGVLALLAVATLVLSACGATTDPHVAPHSGIYGWVYQWLGRPFTKYHDSNRAHDWRR